MTQRAFASKKLFRPSRAAPNKTLQPPSRAQRKFEFATFGSRALRLDVKALGVAGKSPNE